MIRALLILSLLCFATVSSATAQQTQRVCGWFAITACKSTYEEAIAFARENGSGYVVNTSSPAYPNFQSGYFCVVSGPLERASALETADYWRSIGVSQSAFAKSSC